MNDRSCPQTFDLPVASRELVRLHDQVVHANCRVEIVGCDPNDACVIISKVELESLERALEILGDSDQVRELCDAVAHLCAAGSTSG